MFTTRKSDKPAKASAPPRGSSPFSVLGADIAIVGNITGAADLHVEGHVEGDVTCRELVQGESSEIVGVIRAESVRLAGLLKGSVAAGQVVILASARIEGDITYDSLTIEQGALLAGRLNPNGGHAAPELGLIVQAADVAAA